MTKVADIVRDCLLVLRVIDAQSAPEPEATRDCINGLNRMMRLWEVDGLSMGWSDVTQATDDLPAPPEAEQGVIYNLAFVMQGQFGKTMSQTDIAVAVASYNSLQSQIASNDFARVSYEDLPAGTGQRTGSWQDGYTR